MTDPLGLQPLFWAPTFHGSIVTSSLLSHIVDRADVDSTIDYEGVLLDQGSTHFRGRAVRHRTSFVAVSRIPGGHALRVADDGSTRLIRYWDPEALPGPDNSLTLRDCADLLREQIELAVRHVVTAEPVGAHVSGGLDCTSVAGLSSQVLRESGRNLVAGYSWAPSPDIVPRFAGDERALLDDVATAGGFPIRTIGRDGSDDWFWHLDPLRYPNTNHERECHVLAQARRDGVRVLLSGWGGDELASFNGRTVITQLLRRGRVVRAWREYGRAIAIHSGRPLPVRHRSKSLALQAVSVMPDPLRKTIGRRRAKAVDVRAAATEAAIREFSPLAAELREETAREFAAARDHHELQLLLLQSGHLQRRIAGWHQTGHLMGVQYRYPLLDLGVVEAALRLPWWAFLSSGWSRPAFRLAVEPWVPASVAWNVAKYEPALYWPPEGGVDVRALAMRTRPTDDPRYEAVMRLARMTLDTGAPSLPAHLRVVARPDLAPLRI